MLEPVLDELIGDIIVVSSKPSRLPQHSDVVRHYSDAENTNNTDEDSLILGREAESHSVEQDGEQRLCDDDGGEISEAVNSLEDERGQPVSLARTLRVKPEHRRRSITHDEKKGVDQPTNMLGGPEHQLAAPREERNPSRGVSSSLPDPINLRKPILSSI